MNSLLATVIWAGAALQSPQGAASSPPAAQGCTAEEHRQFDFWRGRWSVYDQNRPDRTPPTSEIELLQDGCVLRESYSAGPYSGSSLSFYDRQAGRWHQTWIDNAGVALFLEGGLDVGGRMVLARTTEDGTIDRITWTPNADGTVRQHWQRSVNGGATWVDAFDGLYRRRGEP